MELTAKERAEQVMRYAPIAAVPKSAITPLIEAAIEAAEREAVRAFVAKVNRQAEANMEKTGKLEGAHYAAMQLELSKLLPEREP